MMFRTMVFFFPNALVRVSCPFFFFKAFIFFLYLFICLAVLGLRYFVPRLSQLWRPGLLSSCSVRASLRGGTWALECSGSVVAVHQRITSQCVGSAAQRDQTRVPAL